MFSKPERKPNSLLGIIGLGAIIAQSLPVHTYLLCPSYEQRTELDVILENCADEEGPVRVSFLLAFLPLPAVYFFPVLRA